MSEADQERSGPPPCGPCRGIGKVISGAGGEGRQVECPWCGGTGVRAEEIDAQARHRTPVVDG